MIVVCRKGEVIIGGRGEALEADRRKSGFLVYVILGSVYKSLDLKLGMKIILVIEKLDYKKS